MSLLTNNFLLAGIVATLLIVVYYCYVNYLMKTPNNGDEDSPNEIPLSVSIVDYGKKFGMFYILGLGLVFVGKKYLVSNDATESPAGGTLNNNNSSNTDSDADTSSGGFFSNLFRSGKQSVSNEDLGDLSEVKIRNSKKMENFKTGQPHF